MLEQHSNVTVVFIAVATFIPFACFMTVVHPLTQTSSKATVIFVVAMTAGYSCFFGATLTIYNRLLWKLFHGYANFSGFWKMSVTYVFLERKAKGSEAYLDLPYTFESAFKISQTPFELRFSEGHSAENETWRDTSLRLTPTGLTMSYEVKRSDKEINDPLPSSTLGYEIVEVTERGRLGRPIFMVGRAYHAAIEKSPLYRVITKYTRISKSQYNQLILKHREPNNK